jgi:Uma2 family endonuclease
MDEYAAFGVAYYWLVDPALGSLEIFELRGKSYVRVLAATRGAIETVPGCSGLALDLDDLWRELSRLGPESQPSPQK